MRARFTLALALLAGCSFDSRPAVETVDNHCGGDADCQQGVCDGDICIDDSDASVEVAIEVVGSSPEAQRVIPASWAFGSERYSASSVRDLILPEVREVRGTVTWDGLRIPSALRFVRRMADPVAPLQPVPVEVETLREPTGGEGPQGYDFSTVLVAGETYDVAVLPTSDMVTSPMNGSAPAIRSLPPLYLEVPIERGDAAEPFRIDVSFPAGLTNACTDNQKIGCTLEAQVVSFDGEVEIVEPGLQVRAIDEATGRVVSSIGETNESGRFAIRIGEGTSEYLIRVTSSAGREPFPAVSVNPDVVFTDDPSKKVIYIPRLDPVQYTGRVRAEDGSAVPGATVRFLSTSIFDGSQLGLAGSFTGSATTNEDGSFGLELLPGFYSVLVTPPDDVERSWGVLTSEAIVGEDIFAVEPVFVVPRTVALAGLVSTFREEVAVGLTVLARARLGNDLSSTHRSQEVVSDMRGRFTMRMDLGLYDMHVKVPSETGYAWVVEPALVMEQDLARDYLLQPPIPIEGVVRASDGTLVSGASIRAYVLTSDDGSGRPIQVADTASDEQGNYRLLIAPRLGDE